jgi:hypothetical protein
VGAPVGPTGCTATAEDPRRWTVGLAYGFSDTRLVFLGHDRVRLRQWASAASFVAVLDNGTLLGASLGAVMGGRIDGLGSSSEQWTIDPGVVWSLTAGRRFFGQRPAVPFLLVLGTFSGSSTRTRRVFDGELVPLHAFDGKLDLTVGWTIGESFSPYLAVRGFGGPVLWQIEGERAIGGDLYHVSLALGFNLSLANRVALYFDGAFLGLRSLGGGVSFRF